MTFDYHELDDHLRHERCYEPPGYAPKHGQITPRPATYDPKTPTWVLLGKEKPWFSDEPNPKKKRKVKRCRST